MENINKGFQKVARMGAKVCFCIAFCMFSYLFAPDNKLSLYNLTQKHPLRVLLNDFKNYKTKNTDFHAGDLYEHSIWSANTVVQWWQEESEWVEGINPKYMGLTVVSSLLHDVGKAGDLKFVYKCKKSHPHVGFEYLMGCRPYLIALNGVKKWNLNHVLSQLPLTKLEKKVAAVLCGIHWDYGEIVLKSICNLRKQNMLTQKAKDEIFYKYLSALQKVCADAGYRNGQIDDQILRMAILISAADVRGVRCNKYSNNIFVYVPSEIHKAKVDPYKQLNYEECGLKARRGLLNYYKEKWKNTFRLFF